MFDFKRFIFLVFVAVVSFAPAGSAQNGHQDLRKGDRFYDQQDYVQAEAAYRAAVSGPIASYNAGNAAYQQGKFAEAAVLYQNAARTAAAPPAQASAFYNLGNAYLRAGQYAQAIEAYEHSLRRQPNQPDAKKNLQIAKLKLREQQEPPPPPIPPPPPPPPPKQRPRNNYLDQASIGQKREVPAGGLTPETARSLLETRVTRQEQQNAQAYRQLAAPNRPSRVKKDW